MRRPAMQLLVARAAEHGVEFGADAASIAELADLTRSLAGLPLALELAAARTTVLAPGEIVARLITESDPGDADADDRRQATVAGTVAWSYALCGDAERQMLCRLSVFVAGARLSAIAAVCGNDDGDVPADADPEPALIDAVAGLLAKSLLDGTTSGGVRRFRLQALVRSFAADQQPADEASRIRARHRRWAVAWATRQPDEPQGAYLRRLDDEHDELLEALRLAEQDEPHVAGELALLLAPYWEHRALFAVGDERLHRLAARADLPELMSMRLQMQSARFDVWLGRALPARDRLRGMPDRFLAVGDAANALCAQADLTHVEFQLGELTTWPAPLRALVDDPEIRPAARAVALSRLSNHARVRGEIDAGIEMTRQARDLYRQAGDDTSAALMTLTLGHFAYYQQRESDSLRYYQQALEELIASGRPRAHTAMAQGSVGMAMYWLKDYRGARAMLLEALSELEEVGAATAETAYRLAAIDLECGELNEAERLLIAAVDDVRRTEKFHDLVEALAALAQLHIMRMDFATAELHAREAADLLDRVPSEAQKASTVYTMLVYAMRGLNRADAEIAAVIVAGLRTAPLTSGALLHNGAVLMARAGRLHEAARVMGVLDSAGLVGWEHEWVGWDEYEVRQRMGDAAFEAAASAGRGGSEQEAVDLVLARLTELEPVT
jgi:tetratricopeptide (TPR) repeat protein